MKSILSKFLTLTSFLWKGASSLRKALSGFFVKRFPGKKQIRLEKIIKFSSVAFLLVILVLSYLTETGFDTSHYSKGILIDEERDLSGVGSDGNSSSKVDEEHKSNPSHEKSNVKGLSNKKSSDLEGKKSLSDFSSEQRRVTKRRIKYHAPQVIVRKDSLMKKRLPTGASFLGKLLTNVDTRLSAAKLIRVLLPQGGSFNGSKVLPNKTILLGAANYPGRGKRVFVTFNLAVLPSGKEVQLEASALDSKDFSVGVIGRKHSSFGNRAKATAGLSFLSGFSETLQDNENLGIAISGPQRVPAIGKKATLKNAFLSGLSEFSKTEGALQLEELRNKGPYLTVKAGAPVIISLTQSLVLDKGEAGL